MNVLLIDIGNSRVKARVADLAIDPPSLEAAGGWSGPTLVANSGDAERIVERFAGVQDPIDAIVVSNVASTRCGDVVAEAAAARWPDAPMCDVVAERERCGVVNGYRQPEKLGSDRWMALVGARSWLPGRSVLVCSFGTATTIDLLVASADGERATFVGGLILPGFDAMRRALSGATARLPLADGSVRDFADRTEDAMTSGVATAQVGAVERAVRQANARPDARDVAAPLRCVLTGGNAAVIAPMLQGDGIVATVVPDLVLHGLRRWAVDAFADRPVRPRLTAIS